MSPLAVARRRALALLDLHQGGTALDIGTGPGFPTAETASEIGASGRVAGIDRSRNVDAAAAVQVHEYVPDIAAALRELPRVLRPGGRAAIVDTEWASLVWEAENRVATLRECSMPGRSISRMRTCPDV